MARSSNDRGAAAVEFALVLPILLMIVCAIVDFGRAYNTRVTLTQAAREGVRVIALGEDAATAASRAAAAATGLEDVTAEVTAEDGTVLGDTDVCDFGDPVQLAASAPFTYITPLGAMVAIFAGDDSSIDGGSVTSTASMRCGG